MKSIWYMGALFEKRRILTYTKRRAPKNASCIFIIQTDHPIIFITKDLMKKFPES